MKKITWAFIGFLMLFTACSNEEELVINESFENESESTRASLIDDDAAIALKKEKGIYVLPLEFYSTKLEIVTVDWGDGKKEQIASKYNSTKNLYTIYQVHQYSYQNTDKENVIKVYADPNCIVEILHGTSQSIFSQLDISKCVNLEKFYMPNSSMTSLDLSKNTKLKSLHVNAPVTQLDLTKNTLLEEANIYSQNKLSSLDLSKNTALRKLELSEFNNYTLNLSQNKKLKEAFIYNSEIRQLDIYNCIALEHLVVQNCQLSSLDVSKNLNLNSLSVYGNPLCNLNVSSNTRLLSLGIGNTPISNLDISKNVNLTSISVAGSSLSMLDVSKNLGLTSISIYSTNITKLDVSKNTKLKRVDIRYGMLEKDLSALTSFVQTLPYVSSGQSYVDIVHENKYKIKDILESKNWRYY